VLPITLYCQSCAAITHHPAADTPDSIALPHSSLLVAQANTGSDLAHEVARWQAAEGSVLITAYTVFKTNVLQASGPKLRALPTQQQQQQQEEDEEEQEEQEEEEEEGQALPGDASSKAAIRNALLHGASIVVADEAHELRNEDTQVRMCRP
jgi:signal transduction histidine kinase